jgi:hypothetical protein
MTRRDAPASHPSAMHAMANGTQAETHYSHSKH